MSEIVANRVGTFAQRSSLVQQMMTTQKRLYETQVQLATEQKSQDYAGVSFDSFRLVSIETERTMVQRFSQGNSIAQVRLETMSTSVDAVQKRLHDLRDEMLALGAGNIKSPLNDADRKALDDIQDFAFAALQDMTFYMNARADGRYVFSGGRTDQQAVDLPYSNLAAFQADFDGVDLLYPDTRDKHVANVKLTDDDYGTLSFAAGPPSTITATNPGSLAALQDDYIISLEDPGIATKTFRVVSNTGTVLEVVPPMDAATAAALNGSATGADIQTVSYYNGDDLEFQHRVNERRSIQLGLNAKDPAFEKAIRAMGILSQGSLYNFVPAGTSGNLTFDNATNSVTANPPPPPANQSPFANIPVGAEITFDVPEDSLNYGKTFKVLSNDGTTIEFEPASGAYADAASENTLPDGTTPITGNTIAFMPDRIDKALDLINDAIDHNPNSDEDPNDIEDVARLIGFNQVTLDTAVNEARTYDAFLESRQTDIEQVNTIDAATRLQDDARALEVSFQSYARISQLSLQKFL